jgi:hypothetical protein
MNKKPHKQYPARQASLIIPGMRQAQPNAADLSDRELFVSFLICEKCNGWLVDPRDLMEQKVPNSFGLLMQFVFAERMNLKTPWAKRRKHHCVSPRLPYPTWEDLVMAYPRCEFDL